MNDGREIAGIYTELRGGFPTSRFVYADEEKAPTLTNELIEEVCSAVDCDQIWHEAAMWTAAGEDMNLGRRTLDHIRATLHARIHEIVDRAEETGARQGGPQVP